MFDVGVRRIGRSILGMSAVLSVGAHYDLFKDGPGGEKILVSTSRKCEVCGLELTGAVVPVDGDRQVHVECRGKS